MFLWEWVVSLWHPFPQVLEGELTVALGGQSFSSWYSIKGKKMSHLVGDCSSPENLRTGSRTLSLEGENGRKIRHLWANFAASKLIAKLWLTRCLSSSSPSETIVHFQSKDKNWHQPPVIIFPFCPKKREILLTVAGCQSYPSLSSGHVGWFLFLDRRSVNKNKEQPTYDH